MRWMVIFVDEEQIISALRIVDLKELVLGIIGISFIRKTTPEYLPGVLEITDIAVPKLQYICLFFGKLKRNKPGLAVVPFALCNEPGARSVNHGPVRDRIGVLHGQAGVLVLLIVRAAHHPRAELARRKVMFSGKH